MTPETRERLDYLRQLHVKYHHYWGKYFGFTAKQMAEYMGISKTGIGAILRGRYGISTDREQSFNKMFEELKIMEKTKDFKESNWQITMRLDNAKNKNT